VVQVKLRITAMVPHKAIVWRANKTWVGHETYSCAASGMIVKGFAMQICSDKLRRYSCRQGFRQQHHVHVSRCGKMVGSGQ
jgi:hypothetical protein